MKNVAFPVIDPIATGKNILSLRKERGLTVRDLQEFFGFEEPQAIYRWQYGKTLPSVDNLLALSSILEVPIERILVRSCFENTIKIEKQQEPPAASAFLQLVHEEVGVNEADLFFCFGLSHNKNDISVFFIAADLSPLGLHQKNQIMRKVKLAAPMLHACIPIIVPGLRCTVENQTAISDVDEPIVDGLALLPQVVLEETVGLIVQALLLAVGIAFRHGHHANIACLYLAEVRTSTEQVYICVYLVNRCSQININILCSIAVGNIS